MNSPQHDPLELELKLELELDEPGQLLEELGRPERLVFGHLRVALPYSQISTILRQLAKDAFLISK